MRYFRGGGSEIAERMGAGMMHPVITWFFWLRWRIISWAADSDGDDVCRRRSAALLLIFSVKGMREPARWNPNETTRRDVELESFPFLEIFSPRYRFALSSIYVSLFHDRVCGRLRFYVPAAITVFGREGWAQSFEAARLASYGTAILSVGIDSGALSVPAIGRPPGTQSEPGDFFIPDGRGDRTYIRLLFYLQNTR